MPKVVTPLTLGQIKSAKPAEKIYKLSDGGGLALWILPSGKKSWRFTYRRPSDGKTDTMTLGFFPEFTLTEAREWRESIRAKLVRGEEPKAISNDFPAAYRFENRLSEWHERWSTAGGKFGTGKEPRYAAQVLAALEYNVLPAFKGRDVRTIKTAEIVSVLRGMEERGVLEYLRRTKSSLKLFFDYLVADGTIDLNPVSIIGQQVFRKPREQHFDALKTDDLPMLIEKLETTKGVSPRTRLLAYWQLLSMTRPSEAAGTRIAEIDLEKGIWTIPLERMKRREHIVPLSSALRQIYHEALEMNVNGVYLFEGVGFSKPLNAEMIRLLLRRRLQINSTAHGLRSLARTYLRERYHVPRDVAELLLSHIDKTKTERAYDRSELLDERREALEKFGNDVLALREKFRK